jgi:hypothetical protein
MAGRKAMTKREGVGPTPEQMARAKYIEGDVVDRMPGGRQITIGKAYRRKRMLEALSEEGLFTDDQAKALSQYRAWADWSDISLVCDSLGRETFGRGSGGSSAPTIAMLNSRWQAQECEKAAGSLSDILRAVIVQDMSLVEWCSEKHGTRESCYRRTRADGTVRTVCEIRPLRRHLDIARLELRMAAERVRSEIEA